MEAQAAVAGEAAVRAIGEPPVPMVVVEENRPAAEVMEEEDDEVAEEEDRPQRLRRAGAGQPYHYCTRVTVSRALKMSFFSFFKITSMVTHLYFCLFPQRNVTNIYVGDHRLTSLAGFWYLIFFPKILLKKAV